MKKLTKRQKQLWDLKEQGKSRDEIASEVGIGAQTVANALTVIKKKLGFTVSITAPRPGATMEVKNPEVVAAAIDVASDPVAKSQREAIDKVNKMLKEAGVPTRVSQGLVRRMMVKYADVITLKKQITRDETLKMLDESIDLIGGYIDDAACAGASLRDLSMSLAALLEKRQLISGAPTQIISNHDRRKLRELFPLFVAEGKRRGLTLEGVAEKV